MGERERETWGEGGSTRKGKRERRGGKEAGTWVKAAYFVEDFEGQATNGRVHQNVAAQKGWVREERGV